MPLAVPTAYTNPQVVLGDCLDVMADMCAESVDAFVDDPPAGIAFMGKKWDDLRGYKPRTALGRYVLATYGGGAADAVEAAGMAELAEQLRARALPGWAAGFLAFMSEVAAAKLRVAKPGAMGASWALPRTADLTMLALRLAGWDVTEPVVHLFGGGFPKSLDVSKAIDKMHGAEREDLGARTDGRYAHPMPVSGRSAGIMGDVVEREAPRITAPATEAAQRHAGRGTALSPAAEYWIIHQAPLDAITPERMREITGLDYLWSSRTIKPSELRAEAKRFAGIGDHICGPMPDALTGWGEMIRIAAAHHMLESPARAYRSAHESWLRQWLLLGLSGAIATVGGEDGYSTTGALFLAVIMVDVLLMSEPREPSPWVRWTGRSTRPGHCGRMQLRLDGAVVHDIDGARFSRAKIKTIAANVLVHGTGAINIGATRTATTTDERELMQQRSVTRGSLGNGGVYGAGAGAEDFTPNPSGRWGKNAVLSCVLACEGDRHSPACPRRVLDEMSGHSTSVQGAQSGTSHGLSTNSPINGRARDTGIGDSGGASRFFPSFGYYPKAHDRTVPGRDDLTNTHPTHKNPELLRWLVRLVTPPDGLVLDCFAGSGTTGVACAAERVRFIGVEQDPAACEVALARVAYAVAHAPDEYSPARRKRKPRKPSQAT